MTAEFNVDQVHAAIVDTRFAGSVSHFRSVSSTNTLAIEAAQSGAVGGVYVAEEQTSGRGRGGHNWHSTSGEGLYVSVIVRPRIELAKALWLSLATGLGAQTAIEKVTGLHPDLRWPNDLLLNGRKCGGVLVETSVEAGRPNEEGRLRYAVIGVGINLNHKVFPGELRSVATSLRLESGRDVEGELVLTQFLLALEEEIGKLEAEVSGERRGAKLLERFATASSWVRGRRVKVEEDGGYTGVTDGLNDGGFLRVLQDDGALRIVLSGGVRPQD